MEYRRFAAGLRAMFIRSYRIVSLPDTILRVSGVQLLGNYGQTHLPAPVFSTDYLFLGLVSELPARPEEAPHDCVCIADVALPPAYDRNDLPVNLILVSCDLDDVHRKLLLLLNHLNFLLSDDARYYYGVEQLTSAEGKDLVQIIELLGRLLVNPVVLLSNTGKVLSYTTQQTFTDAALLESLQGGEVSAQLLQELYCKNILPLVQENYRDKVAGFFDMGWIDGFILLPVRVKGLTVATLIIQCSRTPLHYAAYRLFEPMIQLLSRVFTRQLEQWDDRSLLHNLLFAELLRSLPEESRKPALQQRIEELHWEAGPGMRILVCEDIAHTEDAGQRFSLLREQFSDCRWTVSEDRLVLLYYNSPDRELTSLLESARLRAGESWPFDDLMNIHRAYCQAKAALAGTGGWLVRYGSVFPSHVCTLPPEEIPMFLHPAIATLRAYDRAHEGDLMETLEQYLIGSDQMAAIAAAMHIHRGTLFYRINRIREVCHIDLNTGEEKLGLLLSLHLMRRLNIS